MATSRTCWSRSRSLFRLGTLSNAFQTLNSNRRVSSGSPQWQSHWVQAVSNAEKVVGYPTSFLSLRCLMSDEISNIAVYLKKLIGTGHPLLATAKRLVYSKDHSHQTRGLLVLLVSKASSSGSILANQRSLAEITELIHTAHLIHSGVINLRVPNENLEMGNKMAILCGDFLLAHACVALAALHNVKVVELISQSISDISTAEFVEFASEPSNGDPLERWAEQTRLRYGSLLAHACQSSLILGDRKELAQQGHTFGLEIALAWQANTELQEFQTGTTGHRLTNLFPPGTSPKAIASSLERVRDAHADRAVECLRDFPQNEATTALTNIAGALKH